MRKVHFLPLVAALALSTGLSACSPDDTGNAAAGTNENAQDTQTADAKTSSPEDIAVRTDGGEQEEAPDVPVIESSELTRFRCSFGDPEGTDPLSASDSYGSALNNASYSFQLASSDLTDASSPVTCQVTCRLYTEPEDADAHTVSFQVDASDLADLQTLTEDRGLIAGYCNFDDEIDADHDYAYAHMSFEYASGESAWHYCNTACDIAAADRLALCSFFYALIDRHDLPFYYHPVDYPEETDFIEAFLSQAAWDEMSFTDNEGESRQLLLRFDATGRVFHLEAGENVYAGNYKLKKREDDGRWRVDLTLTTWPADYTPMTKGGSILIDTGVGSAGGEETLVIQKYPNQTSIFDPCYGEDGTLIFTRPRSEYFNDKPFATAGNEEDTD